ARLGAPVGHPPAPGDLVRARPVRRADLLRWREADDAELLAVLPDRAPPAEQLQVAARRGIDRPLAPVALAAHHRPEALIGGLVPELSARADRQQVGCGQVQPLRGEEPALHGAGREPRRPQPAACGAAIEPGTELRIGWIGDRARD